MPMIGVSHGEWHVVTPDPPAGDYEAVIIGDKGSAWRFAVATETWEELPDYAALRTASPPGLPAVWYVWKTETPPAGPGKSTDIFKTTNNGTTWTALASRPFTPSGPSGGQYLAWEDHLTAATDGILLTAKWTSIGTAGSLRLKNIYYTTDDGVSWSQVYATDLADGNTAATYERENLVVNTVYTWYVGTAADEVIRLSHGGGSASETAIALSAGLIDVEMLACDSTLDNQTVYGVARKALETKRYLFKLVGTTMTDITPDWGLDDVDLGNVWIGVAGDTIMALVYGWVGATDTGSIWRSTDAGTTWTTVRDWNHDLTPLWNSEGYRAVGVNANRPNTWWVWANNVDPPGSKAMRSTDNGITWTFHNLPSADPDGENDQHYYEVRVLG